MHTCRHTPCSLLYTHYYKVHTLLHSVSLTNQQTYGRTDKRTDKWTDQQTNGHILKSRMLWPKIVKQLIPWGSIRWCVEKNVAIIERKCGILMWFFTNASSSQDALASMRPEDCAKSNSGPYFLWSLSKYLSLFSCSDRGKLHLH